MQTNEMSSPKAIPEAEAHQTEAHQTEAHQTEAMVLEADGRVVNDRRQRPTPLLSRYTFAGGRRRGGRREGETRDVFVDIFGVNLFLVAILIVALNMLDAFFTLLLLSHGGEEANPVALWLLEIGPGAFIFAKTIGIGVCTALLVMIKNFRGARVGLGIVLAVYSLLLGWHFYLAIRIGIYG